VTSRFETLRISRMRCSSAAVVIEPSTSVRSYGPFAVALDGNDLGGEEPAVDGLDRPLLACKRVPVLLLPCHPPRAGGAGDRRRNVDRFYRSWEKWNGLRGARLTAGDRASFEAGYGETA